MARLGWFWVCALLTLSPGCSAHRSAEGRGLVEGLQARQLAGQLREHLVLGALDAGDRVAVLPLVDLEDFRRSSALGRWVGEQLIFELSRVGFGVVELRYSDELLLSRRVGELFLSRSPLEGPGGARVLERKVLFSPESFDVRAIVVGTYLVDGPVTYLNVRLVDLGTLDVLSVGTVAMTTPDLVRQATTLVAREGEPSRLGTVRLEMSDEK